VCCSSEASPLVGRKKVLLLAATVTLATVSWISQLLSLLPSEVSTNLALLGAVLGVIFIGHSAITILLGGIFGIDLLATVAIVTSIWLGEYLAACIVVLMLGGGEVLEGMVSNRASNAIKQLIKAFPKTALVVRDGAEVEVPVSKVMVDDIVVVKPGGMIPVDGVVVEGSAPVNQSSVTGESMPVEKAVGSEVLSGSIVELGALRVRARVVGEKSTYGRIITMVHEAEENQSPIVRLADRFAGYYIPVILILGLGVYFFTKEPLRMASVFIISCPCALTLATPMAVAASIGNSARKGILVRNGESLQKISEVDTIVVDKTGTLTLGQPEVVEVRVFKGASEDEVLSLAAGAERHSEHPLARAVLKKAESLDIEPISCSEFQVVPGLGICVTHDEMKIIVGNEKLLKENGVNISEEAKAYVEREGVTQSTIFVARGSEVVGALLISDTLRDNVVEVMAEARRNGARKIVMLTGDRKEVAEFVGKQIGVDEVVSNLLPSEKVDRVKRLKKDGSIVLMVGDGINDAPALATADVGVAMGLTGTDVTVETAGITLAANRLEGVPKLLRISKEMMRIVKLNIVFALVVNAIGIVLSTLGVVMPLTASIIHESNALLVMLNSLRLLRVD